jgi:hypothetical protein
MEVDIPNYCYKCLHLKDEGEVMVGSPLSGGPEPAYSCLKRRNMCHYLFNIAWKKCPDYTDEDE